MTSGCRISLGFQLSEVLGDFAGNLQSAFWGNPALAQMTLYVLTEPLRALAAVSAEPLDKDR